MDTIASHKKSLQLEVSNRAILNIALPIGFAILVPQLNFITNNIFLGHYSSEALALASITGVYYLIFAAIGFGLNNGLQALISRRAGEEKPEEIGKLFSQGVLIAILIAIFGIVVTWLVTPTIFGWFIKDPDDLQKAIVFLKIRIWGLFFLYIYQLRNALLVGTNNSKLLIFGTLAEAISNALFDYLLIFGKFGFPALGFNGAAVASVIAEFIGMFTIYLVIKQRGIGKQFALFTSIKWNKPILTLILSFSAPLIFQHAISIISWEYFYLLIVKHGETALGVSNVMRNVFGFFGAFVWAMAATTNTMVSNVIGQGKQDQVFLLLKKIIVINLLMTISIAMVLNLFPGLLLSIYGQPQSFIVQAIPVLRVISLALVLMSVSTVFLNAVTGSGNSRITLIIEAAAILFYCLYVYLVLDHYFLSITYGWMSEWLYWILLLVPSWYYMRTGKWKNKVL
ncbi:MAG: MATE family efflux transporter [Chitinophagaceae bacterium]